jgi:hypothetical protein
MLFHALFFPSNKFYNLLPCYPIPIGSHGPKTLLAYFQNSPRSCSILFIGANFQNTNVGDKFKLQGMARSHPHNLTTISDLSTHAPSWRNPNLTHNPNIASCMHPSPYPSLLLKDYLKHHQTIPLITPAPPPPSSRISL